MFTITVDTLVDEADGSILDGDISLRDAIALAPSGETIDFAVTGTILLTEGELLIDKDLTIAGPGAELLTIDASGNDPTPDSTLDDGDDTNDGDGSRVFHVSKGLSYNVINVSLNDLSITGGDAAFAGAILSKETLTISSSLIFGNVSLNDDGNVLHNNLFSNPNAPVPPESTADFTVIDSVVSGNSGGGIGAFTTSGNIIIHRTNVDDNSGGRGLSVFSGEGMISLSEISVTNSGGLRVVVGDGVATLGDSVVTGNISDDFGGGISAQTGIGGEIHVTNTLVLGNQSARHGGGIFVRNSGVVSITESTISGNTASFDGGGIGVFNGSGTVSLSSNELSGNSATEDGGGMYVRLFANTTLMIDDTTFSANTADGNGGGLLVRGDGNVSIINGTIDNNYAVDSGGGIHSSLPMSIDQTTISGNTANGNGGGVLASADTKIAHSTITQNQAATGGGLFQYAGIADLSHTIVADNAADNGFGPDLTGLIEATLIASYSLIGDSSDSGFAEAPVGTPDANGNIIGTAAMPIDPMLGPLQDNGGPTFTHAPLPGSPVIDAGDAAFVAPPHLDQRGYYRVINGDGDMTARVDIGAVEYDSVPPLPGDGNLDQVVNGLDYIVWAMNYGDDPPLDLLGAPLNGDFNDDGVVDGLDYLVWALNFGASVATATAAAQQRAALDAALETESEPTLAAAASGSLSYAARNDDARSNAVDAVFETLLAKKKERRQRQ